MNLNKSKDESELPWTHFRDSTLDMSVEPCCYRNIHFTLPAEMFIKSKATKPASAQTVCNTSSDAPSTTTTASSGCNNETSGPTPPVEYVDDDIFFRDVFSMKTLQEVITAEDREYLMQFLPPVPLETKYQIIESLFKGENFNFGNDVDRLIQLLMEGKLHPVVRQQVELMNQLELYQDKLDAMAITNSIVGSYEKAATNIYTKPKPKPQTRVPDAQPSESPSVPNDENSIIVNTRSTSSSPTIKKQAEAIAKAETDASVKKPVTRTSRSTKAASTEENATEPKKKSSTTKKRTAAQANLEEVNNDGDGSNGNTGTDTVKPAANKKGKASTTKRATGKSAAKSISSTAATTAEEEVIAAAPSKSKRKAPKKTTKTPTKAKSKTNSNSSAVTGNSNMNDSLMGEFDLEDDRLMIDDADG